MMVERELSKVEDCDANVLPITALCVVSDKNKCPKGFTPIVRCHDDGSDADLWRESAFSLWSRPVRYLAISREIPEATIRGTVSVVTDITVVKDTDPIPHAFIAIDYCADSREKSLRKRFICVKTEPRDSVVDAVGEVIILNRQKKVPRDFTLAGEVDGAAICFRVVVVPPTFGLKHSHHLIVSIHLQNANLAKFRGEDGVPFKLNAQLASRLKAPVVSFKPLIRLSSISSFAYSFRFTLIIQSLSS
ncbi:unnamed protein product [Nippostrongylus brasiliensis]|uniref:MABP domain-containing protein n=1 Tax=Nippostrongylus brasiliensis TaxID=27835 RepID=A0A0N4XCR2_NIPBR|nr:unnamed protein product [Nippostrongylus brasiliensis]